jgi:Tfp pilus assembly protein PilV
MIQAGIRGIRASGFAMVDALVALLLLAVCLAGACATLFQTMRTTHDALLTTLAVDLAADLTEELRFATSDASRATVVDVWRERVMEILPVGGLQPGEFAALVPTPAAQGEAVNASLSYMELVLQWHSLPGSGLHELRLPIRP